MPLVLILVVALLAPAAAPAGAAAPGQPTAMAAAKKSKRAKKKCRAAKRKTAKRRATTSAKKRTAAKRRTCRKPPKRKRKPARNRPKPAVIAPPAPILRAEGGADDVTVVAVLDGGINPYHWDFLASKMPQHNDADPLNDLPLDRPATEWLDGYGDAAKSFASFAEIRLSLEAADPEADATELNDADKKLQDVAPSEPGKLNAFWLPGTKIIGALNFSDPGDFWQGVGAHGVGTTSSVTGNIHGTCPECLLFFIDYGTTSAQAEAAIEWAEAQPWIDVISNSYGHGGVAPKIYSGSNVEAQRVASDRGQTIVFSAGNGVENAFVVANPTTFSSQKGPDWLITVGGVSPGEDNHYGAENTQGSYSGAGKPADVAGVATSYPNAYTSASVGGTGTSGFGGTSNAAPTVAGLYARALYLARARLRGPSRIQRGGVIATGEPVACGAARPKCELGDGDLTAIELRTRLLHGAVHTSAGVAVYNAATGGEIATAPPVGEEEFLNEGHGTYFARQAGPSSRKWLEELDRIVAPMEGRSTTLVRPDGELEWMIVDSYCRQRNWGAWNGGYYVEEYTELPGPDPDWPLRSSYEESCPGGPTP